MLELAGASFGWPARGGENILLDEDEQVCRSFVCVRVCMYVCVCREYFVR